MGKSDPAVEETYPAVGSFFHGIYVLFHGFPFLRLAVPHETEAVKGVSGKKLET